MGKFVPFKKKGAEEGEEGEPKGNPFAKKGKGKKKKKGAKKVGRSSFATELFGK